MVKTLEQVIGYQCSIYVVVYYDIHDLGRMVSSKFVIIQYKRISVTQINNQLQFETGKDYRLINKLPIDLPIWICYLLLLNSPWKSNQVLATKKCKNVYWFDYRLHILLEMVFYYSCTWKKSTCDSVEIMSRKYWSLISLYN